MAPQNWYPPARAAGPLMVTGEPAAAYELRPLSTGEVLDRTFIVYRSRFWLFAGISAISGAVQLSANALNLVIHHLVQERLGLRAAMLGTQIGGAVGVLLFVLATAVTEAATVHALAEVYLGRGTSVSESLRATIGRWYRYAGIALWQGWSAVWVGMLIAAPAIYIFAFRLDSLYWLSATLMFLAVFGGGTYGVIAYLRNSLAVPASVIEKSTLRPSMRRSKILAAGANGRIFVVLLIAGCLFGVAATIQTPMLFFIARAPLQEHVLAQMAILTVSFVSHTLISPVALIGLSLIYFDQRVRKEALDLLMLLGPETLTPISLAGNSAPLLANDAPFVTDGSPPQFAETSAPGPGLSQMALPSHEMNVSQTVAGTAGVRSGGNAQVDDDASEI